MTEGPETKRSVIDNTTELLSNSVEETFEGQRFMRLVMRKIMITIAIIIIIIIVITYKGGL